MRELQAKKNQQYSEADYKRLESLMYDKVTLKLEAAQVISLSQFVGCCTYRPQFVIGTNLQACRDALISKNGDHFHLLERTNIDLQVQNSIVPSVLNLARFKVSGKLSSLHVNLSDTKYKTLMRLIEVAIPRFGQESEKDMTSMLPPSYIDTEPIVLPLSAGLFSPTGPEYNVDDDHSETERASSNRDDVFFEASDGTAEVVITNHYSFREPHLTYASAPGTPTAHLQIRFRG